MPLTLVEAIKTNDHAEAAQLLAQNIDVNAVDTDERTALSWAAEAGNLGFVETLMSKGANVNLADQWKITPFHQAVKKGHIQIVRQLAQILIVVGKTQSDKVACNFSFVYR